MKTENIFLRTYFGEKKVMMPVNKTKMILTNGDIHVIDNSFSPSSLQAKLNSSRRGSNDTNERIF